MEMAERGAVPDALIRAGIRRLCRQRLREHEDDEGASSRFIETMRAGPVAPVPEKANEQHYEVPAAFYELVLGAHRKYSCCFFDGDDTSLDEAEALALRITCERARLQDGQSILELGCGWGSLTLFMAENHPASSITAVSNSHSQRRFIEEQARQRGLDNVRVVTADMNDFQADARFDRIVSVEMFEHMRNYEELLRRVSTWLRSDGLLFVHVFCHREHIYPFEEEGADNWMGRHFFSGGIMPSAQLFDHFAGDLEVVDRWLWDGTHYQRTAEAWLQNLDARAGDARTVLTEVYGPAEASRWVHRWRIFFMACAELFGYDEGAEWQVVHTLLRQA
jgi:cyclopropane-fatty-acyl-phospholipid synthase